MIQIRQVPPGFSVDLPGFNLVYNISPFPVLKPIVVAYSPYDVENHLVWIKLDASHYGLFEHKQLDYRRCPTCGQAWNHEGET
jgi:hypothetical protein